MNTLTPISDQRLALLQGWLCQYWPQADFELRPLAGDASFRRYFRLHHQGQTWVVMDAPPQLEDSHSFVNMQQELARLNLPVPVLYQIDLAQGFIVMSDFGDTWLQDRALTDAAPQLYLKAIDELLILQAQQDLKKSDLPNFNAAFMKTELDHFTKWFLRDYLKLDLSENDIQLLEKTYQQLIDKAEAQTQCLVHRDYHSRNLMVLAHTKLGILDFQDAVWGPISYDLASLLRDCYVNLNAGTFTPALQHYFQKAQKIGLLGTQPYDEFKSDFDYMGMQRHLKAIFIFARKQLRDHNSSFLKHIPLPLDYLSQVSALYSELYEFNQFLNQTIIPRFQKIYAS